jgi:hypothetical protein
MRPLETLLLVANLLTFVAKVPVDFHRASRSRVRHSHRPAITAGGRRQFSCRATMTIWPR